MFEDIKKLVPPSGDFAVVGLRFVNGQASGPAATIWLNADRADVDARLQGAVESLRRSGKTDIYFSPATFAFGEGVPKRRLAALANTFRALYVDIDCHGLTDQYATIEEAERAFFALTDELALPPTTVVWTGRGLQAFWATDRDLSAKLWRGLNTDLTALLRHAGLKGLDGSVEADRARVLRLPGTLNSKANAWAECYDLDGPVYSSRALAQRIRRLNADRGVEVQRATIAPQTPSEDSNIVRHALNSERLRWLLRRIPASFNGLSERRSDGSMRPVDNGYALWRNVVWGIKRTGLPDAWDICVEWAHGAAHLHDDLDAALVRTWQSDNLGTAGSVTAGTLVWTARAFAKTSDPRALRHFHFLDEEEIALIEGRPDIVDVEASDEPSEAAVSRIVRPSHPASRERIVRPPHPASSPLARVVRPPHPASAAFYIPDRTPPEAEMIGGATGALPPGFLRFRNGHGLGSLERIEGKDADAPKEFVPLTPYDIELAGYEMAHVGGEPSYTMLLRVTYPDNAQRSVTCTLPVQEINDPTALRKTLGQRANIIMARPAQDWARMGRYIAGLGALWLDGKRPILRAEPQAGWHDKQFALGASTLGEGRPIQLTRLAEEELSGLGERKGTLEAQIEILNTYEGESAKDPQAIIAMMLAAPLARMTSDSGGLVYVHCKDTGTGKSAAMSVGLGLFGDPRTLWVSGNSTTRAIEYKQAIRNDIPVYVDEWEIPQDKRDRKHQEIRNFILQTTGGAQRSRMSRDGTRSSTGDLRHNAPLFATSNVPTEHIIQDSALSARATFARVLTIRFAYKKPEHPVIIAGQTFGMAIENNYGHIGTAFLEYICANKDEIQGRITTIQARLSSQSHNNGDHRFSIAKVACAQVALDWLESTNALTWDFAALRKHLDKLVVYLDDERQSLAAIDYRVVIEDFINSFARNAVVVTNATARADEPDNFGQGNIQGVIIRSDRAARVTYVSQRHFVSFIASRGYTLTSMKDEIWSDPDYADALPSEFIARERVDMSVGTSLKVRGLANVLKLPIDMFVAPIVAEGTDGNVVPIKRA